MTPGAEFAIEEWRSLAAGRPVEQRVSALLEGLWIRYDIPQKESKTGVNGLALGWPNFIGSDFDGRSEEEKERKRDVPARAQVLQQFQKQAIGKAELSKLKNALAFFDKVYKQE